MSVSPSCALHALVISITVHVLTPVSSFQYEKDYNLTIQTTYVRSRIIQMRVSTSKRRKRRKKYIAHRQHKNFLFLSIIYVQRQSFHLQLDSARYCYCTETRFNLVTIHFTGTSPPSPPSPTHTHTHVSTQARSHVRTHARTYMHTRTHVPTHAYTHTHTRGRGGG